MKTKTVQGVKGNEQGMWILQNYKICKEFMEMVLTWWLFWWLWTAKLGWTEMFKQGHIMCGGWDTSGIVLAGKLGEGCTISYVCVWSIVIWHFLALPLEGGLLEMVFCLTLHLGSFSTTDINDLNDVIFVCHPNHTQQKLVKS